MAWLLGNTEGEDSWETLSTSMWERGLSPERGFCLLVGDGAAGLEQARPTVYWDVPFQRCVLHELGNIWRDTVVPNHLEGKQLKLTTAASSGVLLGYGAPPMSGKLGVGRAASAANGRKHKQQR